MKRRYINAILSNHSKIWENIKKKDITIDEHILTPNSDNNYFYIETQKE